MFVGIDLGTSGVKTLAMDASGQLVASSSASYELHHPHPGWSEQDPADWWTGVKSALSDLLDQLDDPSQIKAMALSGQMHGAVLLDEEGDVLREAILWNDTRTDEECREMTETIGEERLIQHAGNPALEGFTAPKLLWVRKHEPDLFKKVDTVLLPKDYIVYRFTGKRTTEHSDAAGTVLYDVEHREWSTEIVEELGLPPSILPESVNSTDVIGSLRSDVAEQLGLPEETKVVGGGADNACSAVGNGIVREGTALVSVGTSGVVLAYSGEPRRDFQGGLHFFNHAQPSAWYLMGVMLSATGSVNWFTEQFAGEEARRAEQQDTGVFALLEDEAASIDPGSDGVVFLPYLSGERTPHQDANARGVFFGLNPTHTKYHLYRSVLEGVAFGLRDSFELLRNVDVPIDDVRITGGGSRSELWCRIISGVLDQPITTMEIQEGPAFGAAIIAGVGEGTFSSLTSATDRFVKTGKNVSTGDEAVQRYEEVYSLFRDLYPSLKSDFRTLRSLES